jgi:hypothetical protein
MKYEITGGTAAGQLGVRIEPLAARGKDRYLAPLSILSGVFG